MSLAFCFIIRCFKSALFKTSSSTTNHMEDLSYNIIYTITKNIFPATNWLPPDHNRGVRDLPGNIVIIDNLRCIGTHHLPGRQSCGPGRCRVSPAARRTRWRPRPACCPPGAARAAAPPSAAPLRWGGAAVECENIICHSHPLPPIFHQDSGEFQSWIMDF